MNRFTTTLALALAANLPAANVPGVPDAYYCGKLADGRVLQLLLSVKGPEHAAFVQIEGNPYSIRLDFKTNTAQGVEFGSGSGGESDRWPVSGLRLSPAGLPASASGRLIFGQAGGVVFRGTNIAMLEKFSCQRGGRIAGRGGGKAFSATWPAFHDGVPLHESVSKRVAAEVNDAADSFISGAYGNFWEGLKNGGARWYWEGSLDVRVVWLGANLLSLWELRYDYTGGAHGNAVLTGRNFVLDAGQAREFKIAQLFRQGVNWTNALSALCLRELRRQNASWTLPDAPAWVQVKGFTATDLASFNVDGRGLIIHFADYSVGPHSDGLFSVLIPWQDLEPLLLPGSPAAWLPRKPPAR